MAAIVFNVLPLIPYLFVFISYSLLWVGRQGFSLLRRRPLRRFAPCALRWQTLTRLLSSAPFRVRTRVAATKKRPASASRFSILWWAVRGSACSAGGRCGAFAPCALRWQTLTRLPSSAPRRVRTRAPATKERPTGVDRFLFYGGPSGVRTLDLGIKSPLLCQLS